MNIFKFFAIISLVFGIAYSASAANGVEVAQFTTRVADRMPVNNITKLSTEFNKVFFYTDIRGCSGCRIEHQWWHKGQLVSEVSGRAT